MKKLHFSLLLLFFLASTSIFAQSTSARLRGKVQEKGTKEPLISASVIIYKGDKTNIIAGAATDIEGKYSIPKIEFGTYTVRVSYLGYTPKEQTITIKKEAVYELDFTLKIDAQIPYNGKTLMIIWKPQFSPILTNKELSQVPAVYDDPARATALLAGVNGANDQANNISVRGNNPNGLKWYLEGIEIPNPNHTPNAGTASDRITTSGGGVNMIKPQFLQSTAFFNGAFNTGLGNATGGILNMKVDRRMPEKNQFSTQIGLIGLEALVKTAINREKGSFLNASVRYSTVGLLTNVLNVDFGGEKISYTDVNLSAFFPTKKYGDFTFFNISGTSSNLFGAQRDTTWEVQKDRFDIDFRSTTTISGMTHSFTKNQHTLNTTIAYSSWNANRNGYLLDDDFERNLVQQDSLRHRRLSLRMQYAYKNFTTEINATHLDYQLQNFDSLQFSTSNGQQRGWLLQPSASYTLNGRKYYSLQMGVHSMIYTENNTYAIEPRLTFIKYVNRLNADLMLSYGLHSQLQTPEVYLSTNSKGTFDHRDLGLTRAHHLNLKLQKNSHSYGFQVQAYYQYLFDIPIVNNANRSFSVINELNSQITDPLENEGVGRNYGVEIAVKKAMQDNYYISVNASLYQSEYKGGDEIWRSTRYNGNYIANLIIGKEWMKTRINKKDRNINRKIGVYARAVYAGGLRESPIDFVLSEEFGQTTFIENQAFSIQQPNVFKLDLRLYWKKEVFNFSKNKKSPMRTHTIALDIQNATNRQNVAFNYFDVLQNTVITKYQLGLIPLLSWRVDF
jgi:hypothetical protein